MKSLKVLFICLAQLALVLAASADDDKSPSKHWYQVTVNYPTSIYVFVGTSSLADSDFAMAVSKGDKFIELDNLLYRDQVGKYKDWHEWDPTLKGYVFLNPKSIIEIKPMVGDPRKISDATSK